MDDVIFNLSILTIAMAFYIAYLHLKLRLLKKSMAAAPALSAAPAQDPVVPPVEMQRVKQRLEVIERIVTDNQPALTREIESLRDY